MDWRKSSHSGANGGSCVEVAGAARVVLVRDTTNRDGRTLAFTAEAWRAFAEELKLLAGAWKSPARTGHPSLAVPSRYPEVTTASPFGRAERNVGVKGPTLPQDRFAPGATPQGAGKVTRSAQVRPGGIGVRRYAAAGLARLG
jgi:hypothetical protein